MGTRIIVVNGQVNFAKNDEMITAKQYNYKNGYNTIVSHININLSNLQKAKGEVAEQVLDLVELVKDELKKKKPNPVRLRNCVLLINKLISKADDDVFDSLYELKRNISALLKFC